MTRKHYRAIATAFANRVGQYYDKPEMCEALFAIANDIAVVAFRENPRFDRVKFLKAAGFPGRAL